MPAHAFRSDSAIARQPRGDDIHDYLHDVYDPALRTLSVSFSDNGVPMQARVLARRADTSTSDIVHDKYFIPGVVASGVIVLIVVLCVGFLLRKKAKPPGVQWATPQTRMAPDMTAAHDYNPSASLAPGPPGSPDGTRRLSNIQRKPIIDRPPGAIINGSTSNPTNTPYGTGAQGAYGGVYGQSQSPSAGSEPQYHPYHQYDSGNSSHPYQFNPALGNMAPPPPPSTAPGGGQWQAQNHSQAPSQHRNYAGAGAVPTQRASMLSTDQSATQVGSDKDYNPGGYGKIQAQKTQAQAQVGELGSPAYDDEGDAYFNPYGGYESMGNTARSKNQVPSQR